MCLVRHASLATWAAGDGTAETRVPVGAWGLGSAAPRAFFTEGRAEWQFKRRLSGRKENIQNMK